VRCEDCNLNNQADCKHCIRCGALLRRKCPNCSKENPLEAVFCGGCAASLGPPAEVLGPSAHAYHPSPIESDNAALAARSFLVVGIIVFVFQFLFVAADHFAMPHHWKIFLPMYVLNGINSVLAMVVPRTRWFPRHWRLLALVEVGLLDLTGTTMNIVCGTLTPHFYTIITFSIGCATFLPWGVVWQSALNMFCVATYVLVSFHATEERHFLYYQWITLFAVLILSEFLAAFIDQYRRRVFRQFEKITHALKASRDKSEFLASMSHEMRTPLNTIIGMIDVLEGTEIRPEQSQYLSICRASGDALIALINDIVDISRIEAGELHLDHIGFDLYELVDQVADSMALRANRKGLELILNVTDGTPHHLIGDPMRLRQVCSNLLVNAIKFTDSGQVVMRVDTEIRSADATFLRFCVADTGVGITPEEQKRIFSRFARRPSVPGGQEGSGLGLEISKRLVEAMGGRIWVESVPAMGSTFYFTCRVDVQNAGEDERATKSRLAGIRVLVIDDNAASRASIGEMLMAWGASVTLCGSRTQAHFELAKAHKSGVRYNVILLDARMPPALGFELAPEFDPCDRENTITMVTSDGLPLGPHFAQEAGIGRRLRKPVKRAELLNTVSSVAARIATDLGKPAIAALSAPAETIPGCRVLLAEDSEENRLLMAAYLRGTSHQLDSAENGRQAVEMFRTRRYELVLIDLNMPVVDGFSAVASMREWEREHGLSPTPILALTGRAMIEDRHRAIAAGCNGHLTKPLRREVLMEAISRFTQDATVSTEQAR
jgi:two-component system, sensor histidine kinase and response regulator